MGKDLVLLVLYCISLPKVTQAEVSVFLTVMNEHNSMYQPYSPSQIIRAEDMLNLTRKRGSTTSFQVYNPLNLQYYWNMSYPYGMEDIKARDIIDIDEDEMELASASRRHRKTHRGELVRESGPYSKTGKVNVLLAISDDPDNPDRWHGIKTGGGSIIILFVDVILRIIGDIGPVVVLFLTICCLICIRRFLLLFMRLDIELLHERHIG